MESKGITAEQARQIATKNFLGLGEIEERIEERASVGYFSLFLAPGEHIEKSYVKELTERGFKLQFHRPTYGRVKVWEVNWEEITDAE